VTNFHLASSYYALFTVVARVQEFTMNINHSAINFLTLKPARICFFLLINWQRALPLAGLTRFMFILLAVKNPLKCGRLSVLAM
jgi:hypothetical protein